MSDDANGLRHTPWDPPFGTPDIGGQGLNGMGARDPDAPGPNGLQNSPYNQPLVSPSMGIAATGAPKLGQPGPDTIEVPGGSPRGSQMTWDISNTRNTIDEK